MKKLIKINEQIEQSYKLQSTLLEFEKFIISEVRSGSFKSIGTDSLMSELRNVRRELERDLGAELVYLIEKKDVPFYTKEVLIKNDNSNSQDPTELG